MWRLKNDPSIATGDKKIVCGNGGIITIPAVAHSRCPLPWGLPKVWQGPAHSLGVRLECRVESLSKFSAVLLRLRAGIGDRAVAGRRHSRQIAVSGALTVGTVHGGWIHPVTDDRVPQEHLPVGVGRDWFDVGVEEHKLDDVAMTATELAGAAVIGGGGQATVDIAEVRQKADELPRVAQPLLGIATAAAAFLETRSSDRSFGVGRGRWFAAIPRAWLREVSGAGIPQSMARTQSDEHDFSVPDTTMVKQGMKRLLQSLWNIS